MAVIFAVDRFVSSIYSELSKFIQGAEYVGHLTQFSSSLQSIVRKQYEDIKSTIRQQYWEYTGNRQVQYLSISLRNFQNIIFKT